MKKPNWLVLNEKDEYVHLIKQTDKPAIYFVAPFNKDFWFGVMNVASVAKNIEKIKGRVGVVAPLSLQQILESLQKMRQQYKLDFDIYLMPDSLFHKLFQAKGDDLESQEDKKGFYLFCKDGKEILNTQETLRLLSQEGIDLINSTFKSKLNLLGI